MSSDKELKGLTVFQIYLIYQSKSNHWSHRTQRIWYILKKSCNWVFTGKSQIFQRWGLHGLQIFQYVLHGFWAKGNFEAKTTLCHVPLAVPGQFFGSGSTIQKLLGGSVSLGCAPMQYYDNLKGVEAPVLNGWIYSPTNNKSQLESIVYVVRSVNGM